MLKDTLRLIYSQDGCGGELAICLRVVKNRVAGFKLSVNNPEVSKVNVADAARAFTAVIARE